MSLIKLIPFRLWMTLLIALMSPGCTLKWHAVLINNIDQSVTLTLLDDNAQTVIKQIRLPPSGIFRTEVRIGIIKVTNSDQRQLFTQRITLVDPEHQYSNGHERLVYLLVDRAGIFPIPKKFRASWKDHLSEIGVVGGVVPIDY